MPRATGGDASIRTPDARTAVEHDVDRILYSDAFRRLGGVTQVTAVASERLLLHTRLTHTLKVAQLARRMAEHLQRAADAPGDRGAARSKVLAAVGGVDPAAAEAAGLAHDLGHPPFGHIGEAELNRLCTDAGVDGFEGNAQSLRVVTKLFSRGSTDPVGLGLDDRTLRAIMKYPWLREGAHEHDNKWGAYKSERQIWERVRQGFTHEEPSLEAMIMDWADDISYAVHDLEDFFRVGQIPLARLLDDRTEREDFLAKAVADIQAKQTRGFKAELLPKAIDTLATFLSSVSDYRATPDHQCAVQDLSRALINIYVSAIDVRDRDAPLYLGENVRHEVLMLKQLTWQYVIYNPALATLQEGQVRVVRHLFERLSEWLDQAERDEAAGKKVMHRLPPRLRHWYALTAEEEGADDAYGKNGVEAGPRRRARSVADYIASLTEVQALDLNERLQGSAPHSIMESWFRY